MIQWRKIAEGVAVAAVGGTAFGFGMQYIFTSGMVPATDWFAGVNNKTIVALLLGATGFAIAAYRPKWDWKNILTYGSVAAIGIGLSLQAGLFGPLAAPMRFAAPIPMRMAAPPMAMPAMVGPKLI